MRAATPLVVTLFLAAGCGASAPLGGPDTGVNPEAGASDAAVPPDTGVTADAEPDAGPAPDLGVGDAGQLDGGDPDSGAADGGASDTGLADTGVTPDTGVAPDAGQPMTSDPAQLGPYTTTSYTETYGGAASGNDLPMDCEYPTSGPTAGPYPAVLIGHGFQLAASQYRGYAERLASFGYVACTADFRASFIANHAENARDIVAGVDWLLASNADATHALAGRVAPNQIGLMGHSLGGKVAFLAAAQDSRVAAVFGLDPVDSSSFCNATRCPDASDMLPFSIPVGVLGETIDGSGSLQNCAPAADNFQTFYDAASSPAFELEVVGANHMSFIDDLSSCGLPCSACQAATAAQSEVLGLARAMTVAFFERHLRGDTGYDTYLSGALAQQRYVQPGLALIRSK